MLVCALFNKRMMVTALDPTGFTVESLSSPAARAAPAGHLDPVKDTSIT